MLLKTRESFVRDQGVGGPNPLAPINKALTHQLIAATVQAAVISLGVGMFAKIIVPTFVPTPCLDTCVCA